MAEERLKHFERHYKDLVNNLPIEKLLPTFESRGLLRDPKLHQEIKSAKTDTEKAISLLDSMKGGLRVGECGTFKIFLEALREYAKESNNETVKKLADNTYKDLPSDTEPRREQHLSTGIIRCIYYILCIPLLRPYSGSKESFSFTA